MIGIVIVAHGGLAAELKKATEHVVGPQAGMVAIQVGAEDDRARRQSEICDAADAVDTGDGVVLVTDMYGGSPSNLSLRACRPQNRKILTGVNLPMLIKLAKSRGLGVDEAVRRATDAGRRYINSFDGAPE
ncbi:PTS fructose transporter subunit IIA [Rhodobacterales bacterium HKCCE2091]|nr:PTS fructose transporter subunit IIA [Rhodobacterales bacterium HKCCE2091]